MKAAILDSPDSVPVYGDFAEPAAGPVQSGRGPGGGGHPPRSPGRWRRAGTTAATGPSRSSPASTRWPARPMASWSSPPPAPPPYGTFAERIASPDAMRFPLPDGASPEAVAAGVNPGMASWLPLQARLAEAGKLATVLILGVTGISGFLAAQNARLLGAASRRRCRTRASRAWTAPPPRARNQSPSPATATPTPRPWPRPWAATHRAWCSTSYGDPSPRPPSAPSAAGACARTPPTSGTSKSARWPEPRPPCPPRCCAAAS